MVSVKYHVRLLIADDHEMLREGFHTMMRKYPKIELIGEAEDGKELVELADKLIPDVIITDVKMPKMDGITATKKIITKHPQIRVIAFTMFSEEMLIVDMLEAGAMGYLLKSSGKDDIITAINTVMENKNYYCRSTSARLANLIARSQTDLRTGLQKPLFTDKELDVIRLICEGASSKQIAEKLELSFRTIEGHRHRVQEKMKVSNMAGIIVYAIRAGIFKL
jgi:two-component system response regulator NreC